MILRSFGVSAFRSIERRDLQIGQLERLFGRGSELWTNPMRVMNKGVLHVQMSMTTIQIYPDVCDHHLDLRTQKIVEVWDNLSALRCYSLCSRGPRSCDPIVDERPESSSGRVRSCLGVAISSRL
jgi:hypothetical protein